MPSAEPVQRVRIYLSERAMQGGQPLYVAVLERLLREGATGATALRGAAGFGAGRQLRVEGGGAGRGAPIVVEWVDRADRVARLLPVLDELLPDALITVEDLRVHRALLRSTGPFGDRSVGEVLRRDVATASGSTTLEEAIELLARRPQPLLPMLDDEGQVASAIAAVELQRAAVIDLTMPLLGLLTEAERRAALGGLPPRTLAEIAPADLRVVAGEMPIAQAVSTMVEWGLEALPVLDGRRRFAGLFGVEEALRAALDTQAADAPVRDPVPPPPVGLLMQRSVPSVAASLPAPEVLPLLLASPERYLVVVAEGRPLGVLTDAGLLSRLPPPTRAGWIDALRNPAMPLPASLAEELAGQTAGTMPLAATPWLTADASRNQAIATLLEQDIQRLLVLDEEGQLAGLVGRRTLLRALAQEGGE